MPNQFIYHPDPNEVIRINVDPVRRLAGRLYKSAPRYLRGRNAETGDQEADPEEDGLLFTLDVDDADDDEASFIGDQTEAKTVAPEERMPEKAATSKVSPTRQRAMTFFEDLVRAGQGGLWNAHRTYKDNKGASFNTHATRRVCGAMLDFIREESGGAVRVSRGTRRFINEVHEAQNQLRHDFSREPDIDEVTEYLKQSREMSVEQVAQVLDARKQALSEGAARLEELAKKIADRSGIPFAQVKRVLLVYNDIARKKTANATPKKIAEHLIVTEEKVKLGFILMTTRYEVVEPPDSDEDEADRMFGLGVASEEKSPIEDLLEKELVEALEAAIRCLPSELWRRVCCLRIFCELGPGEIAAMLGKNENTIKTVSSHAFKPGLVIIKGSIFSDLQGQLLYVTASSNIW